MWKAIWYNLLTYSRQTTYNSKQRQCNEDTNFVPSPGSDVKRFGRPFGKDLPKQRHYQHASNPQHLAHTSHSGDLRPNPDEELTLLTLIALISQTGIPWCVCMCVCSKSVLKLYWVLARPRATNHKRHYNWLNTISDTVSVARLRIRQQITDYIQTIIS